MPLMLQLGEQESQICGVYIPNMIPVVPEFDGQRITASMAAAGLDRVGTMEDETLCRIRMSSECTNGEWVESA